MRTLLTVVLFLIPASCLAQVIVSDQLPPPVVYPAEVYRMSDAQFHEWATRFNQRQQADWEKRTAAIQEPEWIEGTETVTERDFAGYRPGYWYGGYGGYIGTATQRTVTQPWRRPNPDYVNPGPLVIVNPFCRPQTK